MLWKGKYELMGFYRGKVVDNKDPLRLGRVKVKVMPFMEEVRDEDCPWAEPCWQAGILYIPPRNAWVWVFFEEGDPEKPVWFGWSLPFNEKKFVSGSVWEEFGLGAMEAGGMYDEQKAGYPGSVVWRLPMGSVLVFYDDGTIRLKNKSGSEIVIWSDGRILIDAKGRRVDINP